jgi:hypothetical protein
MKALNEAPAMPRRAQTPLITGLQEGVICYDFTFKPKKQFFLFPSNDIF